jgi:hypothetical protein
MSWRISESMERKRKEMTGERKGKKREKKTKQ